MALSLENGKIVWATTQDAYPIPTPILVLSVAVASYLAAKLGGTLVLFPEAVSPLWPVCAFLVSVLALVPFRVWPVLIIAGLAGSTVVNLQFGFPPRTIVLFIATNIVQILIAAVPTKYFGNGIMRLNRLKLLAKYSFFAVLLAPFVGAFVAGVAIPGHYWTQWRISFFGEALAFLIVTPTFLGWLSPPSTPTRQSAGSRLEVIALASILVCLGYIVFVFRWETVHPALLYCLVPLLLWAALRFGSTGVGTSAIVVSFFAVWGSAHGRGPFIAPGALHNVLSLQLFLLFAITPFMFLAVLVDERREAGLVEKELRGRLISAQESERTRIARDLHDDICQRLAMLSTELDRANRNGVSPTLKQDLKEIRQHCSEIAQDVQSLSHQLHSSKLEYLGVVLAVKSLCGELAKQHHVSIEFSDMHVPPHLPKDVSLCLFRVAQEALHNAVKYSKTRNFTVVLKGTVGEVQLTVADSGTGFNVEEAQRSRGLGLVSMQERVDLMQGKFYVKSQPGSGTKIIAVLPITPSKGAFGKRAA